MKGFAYRNDGNGKAAQLSKPAATLRLMLRVAALMVATPALAQSDHDLKEMVATMINMNGFLCATVKDIRPLQIADQYEVTCIEYRGGSGTVRYILDARKGVAFPAGN